jgi:hypothetical protein
MMGFLNFAGRLPFAWKGRLQVKIRWTKGNVCA